MSILRLETLENVNTKSLAWFIGLSGASMILPFFFHAQWFTGIIVNACLILVLIIVGLKSALVLSLVPSLMALAGGLLAPSMAPMLPFIMAGNCLYVISMNYLYNRSEDQTKGYFYGLMAGASIKFLLIFSAASYFVRLITDKPLPLKMVQMMAWPQLYTAIGGGMLAWLFLKFIKRA